MTTKIVNVKTQEQSDTILKLMDKKGWKWNNGKDPLEPAAYEWSEYKDGTYLALENIFTYGRKNYYLSYPDKLEQITYEEAVKYLKPNPMKTKFVNTSTKKQAEEICKLMHKKGWKWQNGQIATDFKNNPYSHLWDQRKNDICIRLNDGFGYGSKSNYLLHPDEYEQITYKEAVKFLGGTPDKVLEVLQEKKVRYSDAPETRYAKEHITIRDKKATPEEWIKESNMIKRSVARHSKLKF